MLNQIEKLEKIKISVNKKSDVRITFFKKFLLKKFIFWAGTL